MGLPNKKKVKQGGFKNPVAPQEDEAEVKTEAASQEDEAEVKTEAASQEDEAEVKTEAASQEKPLPSKFREPIHDSDNQPEMSAARRFKKERLGR